MLTPVQRLYLDISQPSTSRPAPKVQTAAPAIELAWEDVQAILKRKRDASPEELQYIIDNASHFCLSSWQRNDIGVRLTIAQVNRTRPKASDPIANFLYNTLHVVQTPAGLLHDAGWVQGEMKAGANAIANCKLHRPPRCSCWREARERLWYIQDVFGIRSPEAWAATKLWERFEQYERASRPEQMLGLEIPREPSL